MVFHFILYTNFCVLSRLQWSFQPTVRTRIPEYFFINTVLLGILRSWNRTERDLFHLSGKVGLNRITGPEVRKDRQTERTTIIWTRIPKVGRLKIEKNDSKDRHVIFWGLVDLCFFINRPPIPHEDPGLILDNLISEKAHRGPVTPKKQEKKKKKFRFRRVN